MSASETETKDLFELVQQVFTDIIKNKEQQRQIDEFLYVNHKIPRGTFNELLVNVDKFELNGQEEQVAVINAIYEVTGDERVKTENLFDQKTINKLKKYKKKADFTPVSYPYTFKNYVLSSSDQDYITTMTYQEIKVLWDSQILSYNYEIQRKPKETISKNGVIVKKPKVNLKSVKEITQLMIDGKFRSNTIVFNLLMDGRDEISYEDGELTIVSGELDIIDGFHRLSAILNVLEQDPDHEGFMDISIKHLPLDEARFYLGQINKMSKFDKTFVKSLMNTDVSDKIVGELNKRSALKDRITTDTTVSKKKTYLTNFAVLSQAIKDIFEPKENNSRDRIDISEVLTFSFDYLIGYYEDVFSKDLATLIEKREENLMNYHNTFVGYIVIFKGLYDKYGKSIPSDEIVRIVDSIDFSKEGEYGQIINTSGKVNSNQVKRQIRKYFEEKVAQLLA